MSNNSTKPGYDDSYANQVNNVLGFPYIFRGALDVRATTINEDMKIACAESLAKLAREDVPDEVAAAYSGARPRYGPEYIIPAPFDPRLISRVSFAVLSCLNSGKAARVLMLCKRSASFITSTLKSFATATSIFLMLAAC